MASTQEIEAIILYLKSVSADALKSYSPQELTLLANEALADKDKLRDLAGVWSAILQESKTERNPLQWQIINALPVADKLLLIGCAPIFAEKLLKKSEG